MWDLRFYFAAPDDNRIAANLREFHRHLSACRPDTIARHAHQHDFSRWARHVLQDEDLARSIQRAEEQLCEGRESAAECRTAITQTIEDRYLE